MFTSLFFACLVAVSLGTNGILRRNKTEMLDYFLKNCMFTCDGQLKDRPFA